VSKTNATTFHQGVVTLLCAEAGSSRKEALCCNGTLNAKKAV